MQSVMWTCIYLEFKISCIMQGFLIRSVLQTLATVWKEWIMGHYKITHFAQETYLSILSGSTIYDGRIQYTVWEKVNFYRIRDIFSILIHSHAFKVSEIKTNNHFWQIPNSLSVFEPELHWGTRGGLKVSPSSTKN